MCKTYFIPWSYQQNKGRKIATNIYGLADINWNVLNLITEASLEKELDPLFVIGSCSQHFVHGAFQNVVTDTNWKIEKILQSMFYLCSESPARRYVHKGRRNKHIPIMVNILLSQNTSDLFF